MWPGGTHVDLVLPVADQEVVHHARLVQVPQEDHVIHALSRVGVHGAEGAKVLCSDPVFLEQRAQAFLSGGCPGPTCPPCPQWIRRSSGRHLASFGLW